MSEMERMRRALAKIAEVAQSVSGGDDEDHDFDDPHATVSDDVPGCSVKALPTRLLMKAAKTALQINPVNAPPPVLSAVGIPMDPLQIAVSTAKYWGPSPRRLSVSFMESAPSELKKRIVEHMNAWSKTCCISFMETSGTGDVRITREQSGYWSYLGTDVLLIPRNRPTMCLQQFSMSTSESEYKRVVRHETGHTLGCPHEHMRKQIIARIDPKKAYAYFKATQGWDKAMVDAQVLTPLEERSIMGNATDQTSIMCYQLPASITKDKKPVIGGNDINASDFEFMGRIYPKRGSSTVSHQADSHGHDDDWDESEDVDF